MNEKQISWVLQMYANIDLISSGKLLFGDSLKLHGETKKKIHEACRRLAIKPTSNLKACLDEINNQFSENEFDSIYDEEKEWEKHCDYQYFLRHGNDPWWAQ